ncbi:MAG TPA: TCR/Tet family MFS transporter [Rhodanobacteraceae bacterium]|nr:TCR/Tet family MFS transporter [Rhodanobacteraceae bacterium]
MATPATTPAPPRSRAALVFIYVTVLLDTMAFGLAIPVLPHLIDQLVGGDISDAAWWVGIFGSVFAAVQFGFSPVQGALSDRFGRRPVILVSNFGLALDFFVQAMAPTLWLLFVGRVLLGMTAASFTTANAYIADITPREKRAAAYGLLGSAFGVGFVIGPALGGFLGGIDLRLPFWVAGGMALCNVCYGFFILPESLPKARRTPRFEPHSAHPLAALKLLRRHRGLSGLGVVMFLVYLAHYVLQAVFVLYADYRYGWGPQTVGLVLMLVGASDGLVQGLLTGRLARLLGERPLLIIGMSCGIASFVVMGLASAGWVFLLGVPLMALWSLAEPPVQSIMTHRVAPSEQGRLQGAVTSLGSFAGIFGPYLFAQVFASAIAPDTPLLMPGASFLLSAVLMTLATAIAWHYTRPRFALPQVVPADQSIR